MEGVYEVWFGIYSMLCIACYLKCILTGELVFFIEYNSSVGRDLEISSSQTAFSFEANQKLKHTNEALSKCLLTMSKHGTSTASLGSRFQFLMILISKWFFLISSLKLPSTALCCSVAPAVGSQEQSLAPPLQFPSSGNCTVQWDHFLVFCSPDWTTRPQFLLIGQTL